MVAPDRITVVISTYDSPAWLEKVLLGYAAQSVAGFEIVIADDGSGPDTRALIDAMAPRLPGPVRHVWHEHHGFQKSKILNRALLAARAPYLVFTDGDCVPRRDFVATHAARARPGCFLSGGCVKLSPALSAALSAEDIGSGRCFEAAWLRARRTEGTRALTKLVPGRRTGRALDALVPTAASWNGHNASGWKHDLVAVNGFDVRMQYGGQDRELGERLVHAGVRPIRVRYSAIALHLHHERAYKTAESLERNRAIRAATRARRAAWTEFGLLEGPRPPR